MNTVDRFTKACVGAMLCTGILSATVQATVVFERTILQPADASYGDRFGYSLAMGEGILAVGAIERDGAVANSGAVSLYDVETGELLRTLTPSHPAVNLGFGAAVAIEGGRVLVGALGPDALGRAAYLYDVHTGEELLRLDAEMTGGPASGFGVTVALAGDRAAVAMSQRIYDSGSGSGVQLFDTTTGGHIATLTGDGPEPVGRSIGIDGERILIGAAYDNAAFLYSADDGAFLQRIDGPAVGEGFGFSIAVDGGLALVGAPYAAQDTGAAYAVDLSTGAIVDGYQALDPRPNARFGVAVTLQDGIGFVSATRAGLTPWSGGSGAVYRLDLATGEQAYRLHTESMYNAWGFGTALAVDGEHAVASHSLDFQDNCNCGTAYLFDLPTIQCPGDATGDGVVGLDDLNFVLSRFARTVVPLSAGDFDGSGVIGLSDLNAVLDGFGEGCP